MKVSKEPSICKVLVVDDSAYIRKVFTEILHRSPLINVVGSAFDGLDALHKVRELDPDVVLCDLFMPRLDGVGFIKEQMQRKRLPIVVCSSADEDEDVALAAIEAGAVEFLRKPTAQSSEKVYEIAVELVRKVLAAGAVSANKIGPELSRPDAGARKEIAYVYSKKRKIDAIVIGLSTGGPQALRYLMPLLPGDFPVPIAVVLHMPVGYTGPFAERLNQVSQLEVYEAQEGLEIKPGRVVLAKAGYHLVLLRDTEGRVLCHLDNSFNVESVHLPSVNVLFKSAAAIYGSRLLGIVLTGMGDDGTVGASWIKAQGGMVFAEAEETSVIYGMPLSVKEAGLSDRIIPLDGLIEAIMETV